MCLFLSEISTQFQFQHKNPWGYKTRIQFTQFIKNANTHVFVMYYYRRNMTIRCVYKLLLLTNQTWYLTKRRAKKNHIHCDTPKFACNDIYRL